MSGCPICGTRTGLHTFSFDVKPESTLARNGSPLSVPGTPEFDAECAEFGCCEEDV